MNPHLTTRGLWLFVSALFFITAGAVSEQALVLLMGQVQVAVLAISFLLCTVASLAVDRRFVTVSIVDAQGEPRSRTSGLVAGEETDLIVALDNDSWVPLYNLRIRPYGADAVDFEDVEADFHLPASSEAAVTMSLEARRSGRWMLHGFDVTLSDPLGLLAARDYLPCAHALECFPQAGRGRRNLGARSLRSRSLVHGGKHVVNQLGTGSVVRELREYQPGDPLRNIAWKATVRSRRLIARDFEREVTLSTYLLLDISTSMRGGQWRGQKLEHGIEAVADIAEAVTRSRDRVGLMTFDEKLYGHIPPGSSQAHLGRILRHLIGVNSVVDDDLTEWGEVELAQRLADYLVVQERLDFRRGDDVKPESGVNESLLRRWIESVLREERERLDSPILHDGAVVDTPSLTRQFAQLRGLQIPYRVEARLGLKERGLDEALERICATVRESQWIIVVSDLCGVMNTELLTRAIRLAQVQGHSLRFLVPFTPAYYDHDEMDSERYRISRELFTTREREERLRVASHLRSLGVPVDFLKPDQSGFEMLMRPRSRGAAVG